LKKLFLVLLVFALSGLSGCADWIQRVSESDRSLAQGVADEKYSLDELVLYVGDLMKMPHAQRIDQCQSLMKLYEQKKATLGLQIRLALALMVAKECSDNESKIAVALLDDAIESIENPQLVNFLAYQRELALRLSQKDTHQQQLVNKIARWKKINYRERKKLRACDKDLQETRKKLEALKAIEKSLNHTEVE